MKILALIPAYNEETTIADVLTRTKPFVDGMIVIDDGSTDRTREIARAHGATVVSHVINRGLGAAIGTGFAAARRLKADVVVTLDADGQHDPVEIKKFVEAIERGPMSSLVLACSRDSKGCLCTGARLNSSVTL